MLQINLLHLLITAGLLNAKGKDDNPFYEAFS